MFFGWAVTGLLLGLPLGPWWSVGALSTSTITPTAWTARSWSSATLRPRHQLAAAAAAVAAASSSGGGGGGTHSWMISSRRTTMTSRRGATTAADFGSSASTSSKCPFTKSVAIVSSLWGTGGVMYLFGRAISKLAPIALEPFLPGSVPLNAVQLSALMLTCGGFANVKGYRLLQHRLCPLVVARSFTLVPGKKNGVQWWHYIVAPLYCLGLVHAKPHRQQQSYMVALGMASIVMAVQRLPYPWRNIIDSGVAVGLAWGCVSLALLYVQCWITGKPPSIDAALPQVSSDTTA